MQLPRKTFSFITWSRDFINTAILNFMIFKMMRVNALVLLPTELGDYFTVMSVGNLVACSEAKNTRLSKNDFSLVKRCIIN